MPRLAALVPSPLKPLARTVRGFLRAWEPTADERLPAGVCKAAIEPLAASVVVEKGDAFTVPVRLTNFGTAAWPARGQHPVNLSATWATTAGTPVDIAPGSWALPHPVRPNESVRVDAKFTAPDFLGRFTISFDLSQPDGPPFTDHGTRPGLLDVNVTGRAAEDIDYHKVYATADLTRDHWTVVGPSTKTEFDRLTAVKLQHLIDVGLTPDSKILDVGCGTGQLTAALETYLSDAGFYLGTDIGAEAIPYCRRRFTRPNFRFERNGMTTLPAVEQRFDFIVYFSVFTHTYPDETALLLAESKRLLAPGGVVFADVFTSPMVDRCAGHRGAMENNREHLLRLVALAGLKAEVAFSQPWQKYGTREFFKFTHA